jgi:hypothetical protein
MLRRIRMLSFLLAVVFANISATTARADEVTAWNQILFQATLVAQTSPLIMARNAAIVQASVFDAANGIERRYTLIHVKPGAPHVKGGRNLSTNCRIAGSSFLDDPMDRSGQTSHFRSTGTVVLGRAVI